MVMGLIACTSKKDDLVVPQSQYTYEIMSDLPYQDTIWYRNTQNQTEFKLISLEKGDTFRIGWLENKANQRNLDVKNLNSEIHIQLIKDRKVVTRGVSRNKYISIDGYY